jgi:arginine exporter protein ArgO
MTRKTFLFLCGTLMMLIWVLSFGELIVELISQIFNDEPYYSNYTFLYFFAFVLAPFVLNSYMDGVNFDGEVSQKQRVWQKIKFLLLCAFALILIFLSIATYYAFIETFFDEKI